MFHPVSSCPGCYGASNASYRTETSSTVVTENADGSKTTISARLSTSYSYTETRYTPGYSRPPVTYSEPQKLATGPDSNASNPLAANNTDAVSKAEPGKADNSGAATVLAFIEQRLAADLADGASQEALQSRIQAGFDGFIQGYNEALEQLKAMNLFEGEVQASVEAMFNQVLSGFEKLAETYGVENPAAATQPVESAPADEAEQPVATLQTARTAPLDTLSDFIEDKTANAEQQKLQTLLQPSSEFYTRLDEEKSESRLYAFNLTTADGDTVTIRSYADQGYRLQANGTETQLDQDGLEDFSISVNGELDAGELSAISDLLAQMNNIADEFFRGDINEAYQKALEVGFDNEEIARFSLNLRSIEYQRVEQAYGAVANAQAEGLQLGAEQPHSYQNGPAETALANRVARLAEFIRQIESLQQQAEQFGVRGEKLGEFARFASHPKYAQHPAFNQLPPFMAQQFQRS